MHFWGMHLFWWLFWSIGLILFFALLQPVPRSRVRVLRSRRETSLEILQRRFAAGEITKQEYEEYKAMLELGEHHDSQAR